MINIKIFSNNFWLWKRDSIYFEFVSCSMIRSNNRIGIWNKHHNCLILYFFFFFILWLVIKMFTDAVKKKFTPLEIWAKWKEYTQDSITAWLLRVFKNRFVSNDFPLQWIYWTDICYVYYQTYKLTYSTHIMRINASCWGIIFVWIHSQSIHHIVLALHTW